MTKLNWQPMYNNKNEVIIRHFRLDGSYWDSSLLTRGDWYCKYCGKHGLFEGYGGDYYYPMNYFCEFCQTEWRNK